MALKLGVVGLMLAVLANAIAAGPQTVATVFVFTTTDCPIANRYAPEIKRLAERFRTSGVQFQLVYAVPGDTDAIVRQHVTKFAYYLPYVRDVKLELVKRTGVSVTPEVAVENAAGDIVYRGRIDDRYADFGKERVAPTTHDLERALEAIVAGKPVPVTNTRVVGCYLADLLK